MPLRLLLARLVRRISGPRAMSSSRNEFMSAPIDRLEAARLPPLWEMLSLVIAGLALNSVWRCRSCSSSAAPPRRRTGCSRS